MLLLRHADTFISMLMITALRHAFAMIIFDAAAAAFAAPLI